MAILGYHLDYIANELNPGMKGTIVIWILRLEDIAFQSSGKAHL